MKNASDLAGDDYLGLLPEQCLGVQGQRKPDCRCLRKKGAEGRNNKKTSEEARILDLEDKKRQGGAGSMEDFIFKIDNRLDHNFTL